MVVSLSCGIGGKFAFQTNFHFTTTELFLISCTDVAPLRLVLAWVIGRAETLQAMFLRLVFWVLGPVGWILFYVVSDGLERGVCPNYMIVEAGLPRESPESHSVATAGDSRLVGANDRRQRSRLGWDQGQAAG